nr:MAG TPA: hypothetical protein [Caudoviricetes sp.]
MHILKSSHSKENRRLETVHCHSLPPDITAPPHHRIRSDLVVSQEHWSIDTAQLLRSHMTNGI